MICRPSADNKLDECARAIIAGGTTNKIDLSDADIINLGTLDDLASRVEVKSADENSNPRYTIRLADKDLFGGLEPMGLCQYMARLDFSNALTADHIVHEVTEDVVLFRLMPTSNGLRIPVAPREQKPENLAEFRERLTADTPWDEASAAITTANTMSDRVVAELERRINEVENENYRLEMMRVLKNDSMGDVFLSNVLWICNLLGITLIEILQQTSN